MGSFRGSIVKKTSNYYRVSGAMLLELVLAIFTLNILTHLLYGLASIWVPSLAVSNAGALGVILSLLLYAYAAWLPVIKYKLNKRESRQKTKIFSTKERKSDLGVACIEILVAPFLIWIFLLIIFAILSIFFPIFALTAGKAAGILIASFVLLFTWLLIAIMIWGPKDTTED